VKQTVKVIPAHYSKINHVYLSFESELWLKWMFQEKIHVFSYWVVPSSRAESTDKHGARDECSHLLEFWGIHVSP